MMFPFWYIIGQLNPSGPQSVTVLYISIPVCLPVIVIVIVIIWGVYKIAKRKKSSDDSCILIESPGSM
jgi:hypothetical protein